MINLARFIYRICGGFLNPSVICFNLNLLPCSKKGDAHEKANATAKALDMSLQYSFVTPLTSMVVTKPETEDGPDSPLIADKLTEGKGGEDFKRETWHAFLSVAAVKLLSANKTLP